MTGELRLHFAYKHVEAPWGGANNFIRALHAFLRDSGGFVFTEKLEEPCDILFLNQTARGPAGKGEGKIAARLVHALKADGRKVLARAVNLNGHAFTKGPRYWLRGFWEDRETVAVLNEADLVIFQSAYQKDFFVRAGFRGSASLVIHNGADPVFSVSPSQALLTESAPLRLVSSTASPRASKQHYLIAALSRQAGVEVFHCGAWPEGLETGAVHLMGTLKREAMVELMRTAHYFLHPAIKDPCPNAVFEAMSAGLPVIYFDGPGSSAEIVGPCGFAMTPEDLAATVAQARRALEGLRALLRQRAPYFSASRAAASYRQAFLSLLPEAGR